MLSSWVISETCLWCGAGGGRAEGVSLDVKEVEITQCGVHSWRMCELMVLGTCCGDLRVKHKPTFVCVLEA